VHLWLDPESVPDLTPEVRTRLRALAGQRVDRDGRILITSQEHRDQAQNLEAARARLRELLLRALIKPKRRIATRPTRASQARRVDEKKRRAKTKITRRKVEDD
jgi:ribosome-associated protein